MSQSWARKIWERKGLVGWLLWLVFLPPSFFYGLGVRTRNLLYSLGWIPTESLPRAVVSIGNLTVGGTGKTPTTLWLAQELERRGYRVAVLSRGYKRMGKEPTVLEPGSTKSISVGDGKDLLFAGDEPLMMAAVFRQRVGVGRKRYKVAKQVLLNGEVDVFILDDGFQHRRLKRDLDLLLLGWDSNGWMLPAGPFREPMSASRRADLYLVTGARARWESFLARRPRETIFFGALQPKTLLTLEGNQWRQYPLALLGRSKILTVSAIADPTPFYRVIHDWEGEIVDTIEFPDHHSYTARDWQRINRAARNVDLIVTTEKDMVKLSRFPFAREKLVALRVEMVVEKGDALVKAVEEIIQAKVREA